jgi:hypothetical protein
VSATFIREVLHETQPLDGQHGFHSAVDIGIELLLKGRLEEDDILRILSDFQHPLDESFEGKRAFPDFVQCPWAPDWLTRTWSGALHQKGHTRLLGLIRKFELEIEIHCEYR